MVYLVTVLYVILYILSYIMFKWCFINSFSRDHWLCRDRLFALIISILQPIAFLLVGLVFMIDYFFNNRSHDKPAKW